jgi:hypothetical protein
LPEAVEDLAADAPNRVSSKGHASRRVKLLNGPHQAEPRIAQQVVFRNRRWQARPHYADCGANNLESDAQPI